MYTVLLRGGGGYSIIKRDRQTYRERRDRQVGGGGGAERERVEYSIIKKERKRQTDRQTEKRQTDRQRRDGGGGGREREIQY